MDVHYHYSKQEVPPIPRCLGQIKHWFNGSASDLDDEKWCSTFCEHACLCTMLELAGTEYGINGKR